MGNVPRKADGRRVFSTEFNRDYVEGADLRDPETILAQLAGWVTDYNTRAPHSALEMRSPAEYRAQFTLSSLGVQ